MGRPPCCDKVGIKKGPWTPEEDIILVSYIQEHGPGNWRAVPTNTGLMRCSKSCRLRWTNYLRPGIKRGNFTPHEEGMIIHLQALLGNKWAAIATYLPQRTDNDIKNYWNTHLKKKLKKFQSGLEASPQMGSDHQYHHHQSTANNYHQFMSKNYSHDHDHHDQSANNFENNINSKNNPSVYASSAENISRLLEGWMRSSSISPLQPPNTNSFSYENRDKLINNYHDFGKISTVPNECSDEASGSVLQGYRPQQVEHEGSNGITNAAHHNDHDLECILSFDHHHNLSSIACDKSSCDSSQKGSESSGFMDHEKVDFVHENKPKIDNHNSNNNPPLSFLEKWLLDENAGQVEMELPSIF